MSEASDAKKPGYKTSEFWLSTVVSVGGAVLASGVFAVDSVGAKVLGALMGILGALGYTGARTWSKHKEAERELERERLRGTPSDPSSLRTDPPTPHVGS